jgi:hypothetical protein
MKNTINKSQPLVSTNRGRQPLHATEASVSRAYGSYKAIAFSSQLNMQLVLLKGIIVAVTSRAIFEIDSYMNGIMG